MKIQTAFRALIIFSLILPIYGVLHTEIFLNDYSKEWQDLLAWNGDGGIFDSTTPVVNTTISLLLTVLILVIFLVSIIGLFFYKRWARTLLVILTALSYLSLPFSGMTVVTPIESLFYGLGELFAGMVLAMAFLPPVNQHFASTSQ